MTKTIQAKVNARLLTKASRLFTGTLAGRIIEILQNARRAGATHVAIANTKGLVTVRDNGSGVQDFATLLDLGGSQWDPSLESSEDPAGVGLFCLAPREVTVRSGGFVAKIGSEGWTGRVVEVQSDPEPLPVLKPGIRKGAGTELRFQDEPWTAEAVNPLAVFTGLRVTVDGQACPREPFIRGAASPYPALGYTVKVVSESELSGSHRQAGIGRFLDSANALVNFHGQAARFNYAPVRNHLLYFLVDLTGAPTGIRLMLPARTQLVENEAFAQLRGALEHEAYLYLQRQGAHQLPYQQWLRAKELGIELPEAAPVFQVGLLHGDMDPKPVEVVMPKDHPLSKCYQLGPNAEGDDIDDANAHLLAALGKLDEPLVPVIIPAEYDGYCWANLPTIDKVEVRAGNTLLEDWIGAGQLTVAESLTITAHTSDGKVFSSPVCMAGKPCDKPAKGQDTGGGGWGGDYQVYVTRAARNRLYADDIWFHLGGWNEEGDRYETQHNEFSEELDRFWAQLVGPDEPFRQKLLDCLTGLKDNWRSITILAGGEVTIQFKKGPDKVIMPPPDAPEEQA